MQSGTTTSASEAEMTTCSVFNHTQRGPRRAEGVLYCIGVGRRPGAPMLCRTAAQPCSSNHVIIRKLLISKLCSFSSLGRQPKFEGKPKKGGGVRFYTVEKVVPC